MNGVINILKPPGMTSHDVVSFVRKTLNMKKVGHTGTLDPNAAGVLPICIGQGTKVSQFLLDSVKRYRTELTLGVTSDTQDSYGDVSKQMETDFDVETIRNAVLSFIGDYMQTPPMYSAVRMNGKKLYELAREGIEVERKSRLVHIKSIDIIHIKNNKVLFDVTCSKGTYVRTLCHDIGAKLGCGGIMSFLLRTKTGPFDLSTSVSLEEFRQKAEKYILPIDFPLLHLGRIDINTRVSKLALNGARLSYLDFLSREPNIVTGDTLRIYLESKFIGIATMKKDNEGKDYIKFSKLFV
ncbi:MAG: tRNA pseudouridine(55) synthase TruB [Alkaliphilus sp.]|nr:tRNA pseudouridine(55) synthase TruB [Alkaliphilus transvaalensis]PHS35292.1 MAG: tRNA pseudouridine(55) synthase TruB [Alkaliphilus sp.]